MCSLPVFPLPRRFYACNKYKFILSFVLLGFSCFKGLKAQEWAILGKENEVASSATSFTNIATRMEGGAPVCYVVFIEGGAIKVKKKTGSSWALVGSAVHSGSSSYCRLYTTPNGKLLVTYVDGTAGNKLAVKQLNEVSGIWEPLANDNANLYVSSSSVTYSISQFNATPRSSLAFSNEGDPYILFSEGDSFSPVVKKFNGTAWQTIGGGPISADRAVGVNMAVDSSTNEPWIVYVQQATATTTTGQAMVFRFYAGNWVNMPLPVQLTGGSPSTGATSAVRHTAIAFNKDWAPLIAYFNTGSNNRATVALGNKATGDWSLSGVLSSRDAPNISLLRDAAGNVYSSFVDAVSNGSGRTLARVFRQAAGATAWGELLTQGVAQGIDEPAGSLAMAGGYENYNPFIVYTRMNSSGIVTPIVRAYYTAGFNGNDDPVTTAKQMEYLNRGLIAIRTSPSNVYLGWRLLGTDPQGIAFNVYQNGTKVNGAALATGTNFNHNTMVNGTYSIKPVVNGQELDFSEAVEVQAQPYLQINLQRPADGVTPIGGAYSYTPNDCSVGDMDGDGAYEIVVKWDPTNSKDNSQSGYTGNVFIDCYKLDGTRLWRIDLGRNIRAGAHYTQFMVYDFDGDGKAEMACKTADGTIDGMGQVIGDVAADYRNSSGYVLSGPEFLTMFNGLSGAAMETVNYLPARGEVGAWGDTYGNRVDRFVAGVAYLDGQRPSLIMGRGYYTRLVRVAWDWRNGKFTRRWTFDSNSPGNGAYAGQGNHQMSVGDMDGDGKQEIVNGASAQNNNGAGLWANGLGHGDALHLTDMDPDRPGLEVWQPFESPASNGQVGAALIDAKTGQTIFTVPVASDDVGRALAADIDPRHKGVEMWASRGNLYNAKGVDLGTKKPSMNFAIWWDADSTRELLDGVNIYKWNWNTNSSTTIFTADGCLSNNSTKANPGLSADLFGDWREEVIFRTSDNNALRIYSTTIEAQSRFYTLMHDPHYRVAIAWQNGAYNQPPHPGFFLGAGMNAQPQANIYMAGNGILPLRWLSFSAENMASSVRLSWQTGQEVNTSYFTVERSLDGNKFVSIGKEEARGNAAFNSYRFSDTRPIEGLAFYRIKQVDKDGRSGYSAVRTIDRSTQPVLSVYPNPSGRNMPIFISGIGAGATGEIFNATGVLVGIANGTGTTFNSLVNKALLAQPAGLYFIRVNNGARQELLRVLRQ